MVDENGKLMNILTEIQRDVRDTQKKLSGHCIQTAAMLAKHDEQIKSNASRLRWVFGIIGSVITAVIVLAIRGNL